MRQYSSERKSVTWMVVIKLETVVVGRCNGGKTGVGIFNIINHCEQLKNKIKKNKLRKKITVNPPNLP